MIVNLSKSPSIVSSFLLEMRDKNLQKDRLRFRSNIERISHVLAYEMSKYLDYEQAKIETPLGFKELPQMHGDIVVASILRAALPMHYAVLQMFDKAENTFISAYRKHKKSGAFDIQLEYMASPLLEGKTLILCDPMIATGASLCLTLEELKKFGLPRKIYVLGVIGSIEGVRRVQAFDDTIDIFIADIDDELTAKGYIVPGLGDAGDLAFGEKIEI